MKDRNFREKSCESLESKVLAVARREGVFLVDGKFWLLEVTFYELMTSSTYS
jgi:hypothetical protein